MQDFYFYTVVSLLLLVLLFFFFPAMLSNVACSLIVPHFLVRNCGLDESECIFTVICCYVTRPNLHVGRLLPVWWCQEREKPQLPCTGSQVTGAHQLRHTRGKTHIETARLRSWRWVFLSFVLLSWSLGGNGRSDFLNSVVLPCFRLFVCLFCCCFFSF